MKKNVLLQVIGAVMALGLMAGGSTSTAMAENNAKTESTDKSCDEKETGEEKTKTNIGTEISAAGWKITVEEVEIAPSLENVSVDLGYTGVETSDYKKEAETGKTFCMLKMKIEKDGSKEKFDWQNLKLTDSEENEYIRMDDEFVAEAGMKRMTGTALNFGSNEGWIAFEIDEKAEGLELSYPFEEEEYHCVIR